jgi:hypothetical protein
LSDSSIVYHPIPIAAGSHASAGVKGIQTNMHRICVREKNGMKTFISIFAVTLALAFTVPAFAGDTKQAQEQCQKDGGNWDAKTKTCSGKY